MPAHNAITPDRLARLMALPGSPHIIDLRDAPAEAIPGSQVPASKDPIRRSRDANMLVVIVDAGWASARLPTVSFSHLPEDGRTWWVTRSRLKVDRIACPWLIRRFIDPAARFLIVAPPEVLSVAAQQQAEPFDLADGRVFCSYRRDLCTFDVKVEAFGLEGREPLVRPAPIVRGADTDRLDLVPEAAGPLAISLDRSRIHSDDHAQLEAGMTVCDALYRWCRDAQGQKHGWSSHQPARGKVSV